MNISKKEAIDAYGTQQALADALGISRTAVTMWSDEKPIPKEHQLRLKYELRPDIFGDAPPPNPQPEPQQASSHAA